MKKLATIKVPVPKVRKPVAQKPNTVMKSKKTYTRKAKHKRNTVDE
jgi:hypothetical protein